MPRQDDLNIGASGNYQGNTTYDAQQAAKVDRRAGQAAAQQRARERKEAEAFEDRKRARQAAAKTATTPAAPAGNTATTSATSAAPAESGNVAMKSFAAGSKGAAQQMQAYDAATAAAMAGGPAAAMERQNQAAREEAQRQSDMAVQQSIKGAKTAGMMGGQAALAAGSNAAGAYGTGMQQGQQQYAQNLNLGAQLGESMANRLFTAGTGQSGQLAAQAQADAARRQANQQMFGNIFGAVGGIASLFSDRRLKESTRPARIADGLAKIKSYTYKYKGSDRPEAGVMAQDLEKTAMAPAVEDTPQGKMVDTRRLSTMNTAALAEHEKRMQAIEKMLKGMGEMQ